jgi:hypothetical protein
LSNKRGLEWYGFEFDDHIATKLRIIKEQVEVKVLIANLKEYLATNGS